MPFLNNRSLPAEVKGQLPPSGQQIWRTTFNAQQAQGVEDAKAEAAAWAELKQRGWTVDAQGNWNPPMQKEASHVTYDTVLKQDATKRYTLGVVYEPNVVDTQGDMASAETIEQAAWQFMRQLQGGRTLTKWAAQLLDAIVKAVAANAPVRLDITGMTAEVLKAQRALGDQHTSWDAGLGEIVECYVMPCDGEVNGERVTKGTWMLGVQWSPDYFAKIQSGERTGLSMGGTGKRRWVETLAA